MIKQIITIVFFSFLPFLATAQKQITLEDIWKKGTFAAKSISGIESMNDGEHYTTLASKGENDFIIKYNYVTGKVVDTIVKSSQLNVDGKVVSIDDYSFDDSETKVLITSGMEQIYRHSFKSNYYIYDFKSKVCKALSNNGKQMLASFSPDGKKVAFVRDNNLFVTEIATMQEAQITKDGEHNKIINGACDWVYEEEFGFDKAYQWNADGTKLAYYRFDESQVKEYGFPQYSTLYPTYPTYKYPKAGEANAIVNLIVFSLTDKKNVLIETGKETNQYIARMLWTKNPNQLSFQRLNRLQNNLDLMIADATTGKSSVILNEKNNTYVDVSDDLTFLKDGKTFIWSSEKEGFNQLYHYAMDGKLINKITTEKMDIISYEGIDEKSGTLFYTAAEKTINKQVYSIKLNGSGISKISPYEGYNTPKFSNSFAYFININTQANSPAFYSLVNAKGKEIRVLEDNKELKNKLAEYNLGKKEFMTIKTADNVELNAWMIKPANFDANKKYPVLFVIYGGPGHNTVLNSWDGKDFFWHQLLAQKGYIIVSVDNRGTGFKGADFKKSTYGKLGELETADQIAAAKYFQTLPYVDAARIGMEGWSFGGYLSSLCITKGADVFKAAIAVAPVTNWRYYDSIYTERFLALPQDNAKGYDDNSPINFVENLKGKYLLVHGTADDNVHFQNSVEMVTALQKAGKQFDLMIYPDKAHGISGTASRFHLYTKMTDFVLNNL